MVPRLLFWFAPTVFFGMVAVACATLATLGLQPRGAREPRIANTLVVYAAVAAAILCAASLLLGFGGMAAHRLTEGFAAGGD